MARGAIGVYWHTYPTKSVPTADPSTGFPLAAREKFRSSKKRTKYKTRVLALVARGAIGVYLHTYPTKSVQTADPSTGFPLAARGKFPSSK